MVHFLVKLKQINKSEILIVAIVESEQTKVNTEQKEYIFSFGTLQVLFGCNFVNNF